ncbi:MAG: putative glycosyltransferase EpsJ [Microgenomates bacterium OLB23]|nr:MAG: putative glycosyltransferase EpsJ [Microgenomates bacterium OLB23]
MISIVIPVYNEEEYIDGCLKSLISQKTDAKFEVVIVDNNSTDRTVEIVQKYTSKLPLRILHEDRQGIVFARSRGFDEAKGTILARIDADCIAPNNWIANIEKNFEKKIDGVCGPYHYYDGPWFVNNPLLKTIYLAVLRMLFGHETMLGFNCALTSSIWRKVRVKATHMPMRMHEDLALGTLISKHGTLYFDKHLLMNTSFRRLHRNFFFFCF